MEQKQTLKIGVLASGGGTNFQAIIDAIEARTIKCAELSVLICNKKDAFAIERAKKHNIPHILLEQEKGEKREDYDRRIIKALQSHNVALVILAGFMRIISHLLVESYPNRIMNIHPALLPSFPGLDVQQKALEYGVKFSGCTVHFVDKGVDTGPIIIQAAVPVLNDDTVDTLSARILKKEHQLYPEAIRLFSEGRLSVEGRRVIIKDADENEDTITNPPIK